MTADRRSATQWDELYAALETEQASAYVLAPDLSLRYVNAAWKRSAVENGAPELAANWAGLGPITQSIDPAVREFYAKRLALVLSSNRVWSHRYECSNEDVRRRFKMRVEPAPGREGLVVVHAMIVEAPLGAEAAADGHAAAFTNARGMIVRCSACGRVQRPAAPSGWDWVPGLPEAAENVSHGLCAICTFQYYGHLVALP